MAEYVFAYGSLVRRAGAAGARLCELAGHRRSWGVAMDNTRTIPGYKYYVDAETGERPPVFVAFLDLAPGEQADATNGIALPVGAGELEDLDRRERNYVRIDVTAAIAPLPAAGRVWAFVGSAGARRRRDDALAAGRLVVSAGYLTLVESGFAALGPDGVARYRRSTDDPPCPVVDLRRIDLPRG